MLWSAFATALAGVVTSFPSAVGALGVRRRPGVPLPPLPPPDVNDGFERVVTMTNGTFQQFLDHDRPERGTFSQRYWFNADYYSGAGSPIVLFTPGEIAADGYERYLTNSTITGTYAQELGGAVFMLEHRYYGQSSPFDLLTTKNMQYLTLKNAIADLVHFAKTVDTPFASGNGSAGGNASANAPHVPWLLVGGSYSGALSAWTESTSPGTFWAYHATSAPVEAIFDFWQYFVPIQEGMPKNCSKDVSLVIDHVDSVLDKGTDAEKSKLKGMFGLGTLEYADDFGAAIENGPWEWQENTFYTGYSGFFQFCDYVENAVDINSSGNSSSNSSSLSQSLVPGAEGVGLEKALAGYAAWTKNVLLPGYCSSYGSTDPNDLSCLDMHNTTNPYYTDLSVNNPFNRQWNWLLCNEPFAYWQDGAPSSRPSSLVSRHVTVKYWQDQCALFFPEEDGVKPGSENGKSVNDVNAFTKGWDEGRTTRLLWVNGQFDPWRSTSVSSDFRPQGPLPSTRDAPVLMIPGGFHCSDLYMRDGAVNEGVHQVQLKAIAQMKIWVDEFGESQKGRYT